MGVLALSVAVESLENIIIFNTEKDKIICYRRTHCTIAQVLVLTICNIRKTRWADSVSEQNNFLDSTVSPSSLDPRVGDS